MFHIKPYRPLTSACDSGYECSDHWPEPVLAVKRRLRYLQRIPGEFLQQHRASCALSWEVRQVVTYSRLGVSTFSHFGGYSKSKKEHTRGVPRNKSQREFKQTPKGICDERYLLPTPGSSAILLSPPQSLTYLYHHLLFNPFILFQFLTFVFKKIIHICNICIQWVCIHNGEAIVYMCTRKNYVCVAFVFVYKHAHVLVQAYMCHAARAKVKGQLWMSILPFPLFEIVFVTARARLT